MTKLGAPGFLAAFVAGQHHAGKFAFSATIFTVNWLLYLILFWPVFGLLFSLRDSDSGPSTKS